MFKSSRVLAFAQDNCLVTVFSQFSFVAMAGINSKAVFQAKLKELGLADLLEKFTAKGWTTMRLFAFSANYAPGQDDVHFNNDVVIPVLGAKTDPRNAALRCLHFDCYAVNAAEVARMVTKTDEEDRPRKLPLAERGERFKQLVAALPALAIDENPELEPSHALTDKAVAMHDSGELRYIKWEECTRRDDELVGVKKEDIWKTDEKVNFKHFLVNVEQVADTGTALCLKECLQRRGMSFQMGHVMTFKTHEKIERFLMTELRRKPLDGYSPCSLQQLQRADQAIFQKATEMTRGGFAVEADGTFPLDAMVPKILEHPRIVTMVLGLPKGGGGGGGSGGGGIKRTSQDAAFENLKVENKRLREANKKGGDKKGNRNDDHKKKGGEGKGKKGNKTGNMPKALHGMLNEIKGKRLCFDHNLGGCDLPTRDGACDKGLHACCKPKCGGSHGLRDCRK